MKNEQAHNHLPGSAEWRLAQAALRESEARHRLLIGSWAQALWETDGDGIVTVDSPSWRAYTGQTLQEWLGRGWLNAIHPDDRVHAERQWWEVVAARGLVNAEFRLCTPDGGWRWTNVRAAPVLDSDGKVEKWAGMNIDIDDRKQAEAVLRDNGERQAFLLRLSDALRPLSDPGEIQQAAMRNLCEGLGVARASFYEIGDDQEHFRISETYSAVEGPAATPHLRFSTLGFLLSAYRAGETLVFNDIAKDPRFDGAIGPGIVQQRSAAATVAVPLVKDGRLIAKVAVHRLAPHHWSAHEIAMVQETAERTWAAAERGRAEAARRVSEEKYRHLFESIDEGFAVIDLVLDEQGRPVDTLHLEANPAYERHTGLRGIVGKRGLEVLPEIGEWLDFYGKVARTGEAVRAEYFVEPLGRWLAVYVSRIGGEGSLRLAVVFSDVTERKRTEEALQKSEAERRILIEEMNEGFCILEVILDDAGNGVDYRFLETNPAFVRQGGFDPAGRLMSEIAPIEPIWPAAYGRVATTGVPERIIDAAASFGRTYDVYAFRIGAAADHRIAVFFSDITERKRMESALREEERFSRALVEGVPQLVWRAVDSGQWTWASPQWIGYTGQAEADSHDMGWLGPVHPDDRERVMTIWNQAVERGEFHAEYRVCHAEERHYRWFQTRATPVRDDEGRIIEWLGTSTDVDDLRELQERQKVLVAELQHRTRNLLGVVRSMADRTTLASTDLPDFRQRFRDRLEALARVQGLLSRLNDYDRVTFDELIDTELSAMSDDTGRIVVQGPAGVRLRSSTVQTLAMGLHELATNAVKYGALGQPQGHLAVTWSVGEPDASGRPWLHIDWRETGVTMAAANAPARGSGQGRELIERALPYQLGARTTYELGGDGVHCTIAMPVSASAAGDHGSA